MNKIGMGILLILLALIGGGHKYIFSWDSAELVGRNTFTLLLVIGGLYLINKGRKGKVKPPTS